MEIRPAQESDADLAITFLRDYRGEGLHTILKHGSLPDRQNQEEFIRSHDGDSGIMLLCVKDGKIVGSLTAMKKQHPQLEHSCEFGMGILKEERGRGIGTALIHHLFNWANSVNVTRIELAVAGHNRDAIRLYERLGFTIEGAKKCAMKVEGRYEDIIDMAWIVEPDEVVNSE